MGGACRPRTPPRMRTPTWYVKSWLSETMCLSTRSDMFAIATPETGREEVLVSTSIRLPKSLMDRVRAHAEQAGYPPQPSCDSGSRRTSRTNPAVTGSCPFRTWSSSSHPAHTPPQADSDAPDRPYEPVRAAQRTPAAATTRTAHPIGPIARVARPSPCRLSPRGCRTDSDKRRAAAREEAT